MHLLNQTKNVYTLTSMACCFVLIVISVYLYFLGHQKNVDQCLLSSSIESSVEKNFSWDLPEQNLLLFGTENFSHVWKNALQDFKLLRETVWPYLDQLVRTTLQSECTAYAAPSRRWVSGGIFLQHRLTEILLALTEMLLEEDNLKTSRFTACETGFGAGHGIALYWAAASRALKRDRSLEVVSFDFYSRVYQPITLNWLSMALYNTSSKKLISVKGNTCNTVPEYFNLNSVCGILHGSSLCPSDNIDLVLFAAGCGTLLTSTAMYSLESTYVYFKNFTNTDDPLTFLPNKNGQWL